MLHTLDFIVFSMFTLSVFMLSFIYLSWRSTLLTTAAAGLFVSIFFNHPWFGVGVTGIMMILAMITAPLIWKKVFARFIRWVPAIKISDTEKMALSAGSPGLENELVKGGIDWAQWYAASNPEDLLNDDETKFLIEAIDALAQVTSDWDLSKQKTIPADIWQIIQQYKFFGMIIPKEYEGLGFSAYAHHRAIAKISTFSGTLASMIGVPNSLGPAELLLHYGTDQQKQYYLPRLAKAEEIPCFALTSPWAGSDAGSIQDSGTVGRRDPQDPNSEIGIWIKCDKRYITLAPIATLIGMAFQLRDPQKLLSSKIKRGITLALIPRQTEGLDIGAYHAPMDTCLINGPVRGHFFIPISAVIGGVEGIGKGWKMLMECLSVGRAVTLPSVSTGTSILSTLTTGAYMQVRQQFGVPLIQFEGVQEDWLQLVRNTISVRALAGSVAYSVDQGERPMIGSAIAKYQTTELSEQNLHYAMDIHAGKGVQAGPSNYLALPYQGAPISITVEGANILTKHVMVYAPAVIKGHPYLYHIMSLLQDNDPRNDSVVADLLTQHVGWGVEKARAILKQPGVNRHITCAKDVEKLTNLYASYFAWLNEWVLLSYGAGLKTKERQAGRMADILSALWMCATILRQYKWDGEPEAQHGFILTTCTQHLQDAHHAIWDVIDALPRPAAMMASCLISTRSPECHLLHDRYGSSLSKIAAKQFYPLWSSLIAMKKEGAVEQIILAAQDKDFLEAITSKKEIPQDILERWRSLIDVDEFETRH